jgi:hypothetical protein
LAKFASMRRTSDRLSAQQAEGNFDF